MGCYNQHSFHHFADIHGERNGHMPTPDKSCPFAQHVLYAFDHIHDDMCACHHSSSEPTSKAPARNCRIKKPNNGVKSIVPSSGGTMPLNRFRYGSVICRPNTDSQQMLVNL